MVPAMNAIAENDNDSRYEPNNLLDELRLRLNLKNDSALSTVLEVGRPIISRIRHHRLPVGAAVLIRMHETSGLSIAELRDLMGDRRAKFRFSEADGRPNSQALIR